MKHLGFIGGSLTSTEQDLVIKASWPKPKVSFILKFFQAYERGPHETAVGGIPNTTMTKADAKHEILAPAQDSQGLSKDSQGIEQPITR